MIRLRRAAPPIAVQVLCLLVGGLVAAQAATFAFSTLWPSPPPPQYSLRDIAAALRGGPLRIEGLPALQRAVQRRAPDPGSPGWQVSQAAQRDLAGLLQADPADVALLFYSPPPFAGAEGRRADLGGPSLTGLLADALAPPALAGPGPFPGMGFPGGGPGPGGGGPGRGPGGGPMGSRGGGSGGGGPGGGGLGRGGEAGMGPGGGQVFDAPVTPVPRGAPDGPGPGGPGGRGGMGGIDGPILTAPPISAGPDSFPGASAVILPPPASGPAQPIDPPVHPPRPAPALSASPLAAAAGAPAASSTHLAAAPGLTSPIAPSAIVLPSSRDARRPAAPAVQVLPPPVVRTLFGFAPPPMVDGEFLAALKTGPERWVTVRPQQDAVLSRWQRRVGLWFLAAFSAVAPLGWWIAGRLAAPLAALADTAERLGRDPATPVPLTGGSSEIERLAAALAGMQARLQRHVEDRTAMVGAISHDLRTPLARLRFKLERAPPALQASMLRDLAHMQEMLDAVLLFIRDASGPSPREIVDLRSIVECVVDDAALVGGDASLEPGGPAAVEVDISAVQRVVVNLIENALKYGGQARVSLLVDGTEAMVRVRDAGPGVPEAELEQVFQPFYRSEEGRRVSGSGIGLGLSVSRSIARAHGGEVVLRNAPVGLVAEFRLPLALTASPGATGAADLASAA